MSKCGYSIFLLKCPAFFLLFGNRPWVFHPPLYLAVLSGDRFQTDHPAGTLDPLAPAVGPWPWHCTSPLQDYESLCPPVSKSIWPMLADQTLCPTSWKSKPTQSLEVIGIEPHSWWPLEVPYSLVSRTRALWTPTSQSLAAHCFLWFSERFWHLSLKSWVLFT